MFKLTDFNNWNLTPPPRPEAHTPKCRGGRRGQKWSTRTKAYLTMDEIDGGLREYKLNLNTVEVA